MGDCIGIGIDIGIGIGDCIGIGSYIGIGIGTGKLFLDCSCNVPASTHHIF